MIEYARKTIPSVYIITSTNGHFLASEESRMKAINCGLDEIIWSIDGSTQTNYEKYRRGGNLGQVLENLTALLNLRKALQRDKPKMIWRYILLKWNDNDKEMKRARKISNKIKVDKFLWHLTTWPKESVSKRFHPDRKDFHLIKDDLDPCTGNFFYGYFAED